MNSLNHDYPDVLLHNKEVPCLSLYQTTHRLHPDNVQDPIRFRNLVKELEESLRQKYPKREVMPLLEQFHTLADNAAFWNHTTDGLAVLAAPGMFRVYCLPRPVADLVVVADSFHTKPLMRITQSADHYQILGLSRSSFKLFEGNRDNLVEMFPMESGAWTAEGMLGKDPGAREGAHRAYGPTGGHGPTGGSVWSGTDVKQNLVDRDTEQFFRAVDQAVMHRYDKSSGMGLILAALPEHHNLFRSVSKNPQLLKDALDVHPDAMSIDALRERAWQLIQPQYLERLAGFVDSYGVANGRGQGSDLLDDIAKAAVEGRVATLLIEADRIVPGQIDVATGRVTVGKLDDPEVDDLLDDLGELVLKTGGEVVIVPAERMPTNTGAAAVFRF
ncbi:baeRF3 domain-containing protein [Nitrosomonas eutropha]|uniref:Uncharacterized protein n=2 Tax=Nitrosomonas eutropha TaxID=916 RepID=A0ABX5M5H8_9PROT|nr:hypothetical protein [Nitrosomonas eutropha]ABI58611.1 conserved hypothetical protein [Nitrosomonas eutropha C91]PXV79706.1 hypothetical protein C8R14_12224 [Nitrosomonas eutropha]SCX23845.1 hypothetical protein SAMN05216379_12215 [Nitrosomonas eutropha]SEJ03490.1 hypothetical protein SAMN05216318_12127 [Nitrosomonas eutropha]